MIFTASEVGKYCEHRFPDIKHIGPKDWRTFCPIHRGDGEMNFSINPTTGLAQCHSRCGRGWDLISLEQEMFGVDFVKAKERVFDMIGRPRVEWSERDIESTFDYTDEKGRLLYQVVRKRGKKFMQRRPDGNGGWKWGLEDVCRVPFNLPKVIASEFCGIAEGEKDAITLESIGIVGTCNNGGAGNFKPELVEHFAGKQVAIFPDNDDPGREHAIKVAKLLISVAKSIKIVELPGLPPKGDVTDFVNAGGTIEQIREIYRKAQQWTPEWVFSSDIPSPDEKYIRTFSQEIEIAGGLTAFWDLSVLMGIETPWRRLSRILGGGLRDGEVYVLGANQGAGKTSMALQFIIAAIRKTETSLLFSMEMGWRSVFQRMAGIEAGVNLNRLREAQYARRRKSKTPEDEAAAVAVISELMPPLARATSDLADLPLLVSTRSSVTPEYILEETNRLSKQRKIKFVIVDHMQLMGATDSNRGDYEKFTSISRAMKQVAVDLGVPVLLVSQTSRAQSKEHRAELEVSDLRGSGALEEDAAAVMLLYEDAADKLAAKEEGRDRQTIGPLKCFLKIGKNRFGEQGKCLDMIHYKEFTKFDVPQKAVGA